MEYVAEFKDGYVSPVKLAGDNGKLRIGIAYREDGKARVLFFYHDVLGDRILPSDDPWISAIRPGASYVRDERDLT